MWYSEIDAKGKIVHSVGVRNLNRGVMAHDMAITASRAILFDLPITFDLTRVLLSGETPVQFVKDAPARIGIMPRGGSQVKWIDIARRGNVFHTFNAYDDPTTGEIVLHGLRSEPRKSGWIFNDYAPSFLHEWRINEGEGTVQERRLGNIAGEFPCVNPNFVGRKAEYGYMLVRERVPPNRTTPTTRPDAHARFCIGRRRDGIDVELALPTYRRCVQRAFKVSPGDRGGPFACGCSGGLLPLRTVLRASRQRCGRGRGSGGG